MGEEGQQSSSSSVSSTSDRMAVALQGPASERIKSDQIAEMRNRIDAHLASLVAGAPVGVLPSSLPAKSKPNQHWVIDPYGDQGNFEGELNPETKLPHGRGRMEYTDGRIYEGDWDEGQWHGYGRAIFSNRDAYEGFYDHDQRHGRGKYDWSDGRCYKGEFQKDQRHGQGVYTWPDGAKYEGMFAKGLRQGFGSYTFRDGSVYKGQWRSGKYHGQGECRWADGRVYTGEWAAGKAHGQGIETRPDGSVRHNGLWENDKPVRDVPSSSLLPSSTSTTTTTPLDSKDQAASIAESLGEKDASSETMVT